MKKLYFYIRRFCLLNALTQLLFRKRLTPFILCYHQINEGEFRDQVRSLKKLFDIVDLNEFVDRQYDVTKKPYCALTMDDCIREDVEKVLKILEEEEVPLTLYLPTLYSEKNRSMWPNKITYVISQRDYIKFGADRVDVSTSVLKMQAKDGYIKELLSMDLQTNNIEELVGQWMAENNFKEKDLPANIRVIKPNEVRALSNSPWLQFESHSCDHPFIHLLDEVELESALRDSKEKVKQMTGSKVNSFCYPYGSAKIIGEKAPILAKKYYSNATTLIQGVCGQTADPYYLPRIGIYPGENQIMFWGKLYHYQNMHMLRKPR